MSFLEDAQNYMKSKPRKETSSDTLNLSDETNIENLIKELKITYENATQREIIKMINQAKERFGDNPNPKDFYIFARIKLED